MARKKTEDVIPFDSPPEVEADDAITGAVKDYLALRAQKDELKNQTSQINAMMEKIEKFLFDRMQSGDEKFESVRTAHGTVYLGEETFAKITDKTAFFDYIKNGDRLEVATISPNKAGIKQHLDVGEYVPGVELSTSRVARVRKK